MSRLEEIENDWFREDCIGNDNITWLIQQAQKAEELQAKVDELEKELKTVKTAYDDRVLDIDILDRENQRYKQALEELREKTKESVWHADIYIIVSKALKGVEG